MGFGIAEPPPVVWLREGGLWWLAREWSGYKMEVSMRREKSPLSYQTPGQWTWTRNMFLFLYSQFSHPGNEGILLAAGNLVAAQLKLHDLVKRGERPGEGLHVRALVVDDVVVVKLKVVQAGRPVEVLEPGQSRAIHYFLPNKNWLTSTGRGHCKEQARWVAVGSLAPGQPPRTTRPWNGIFGQLHNMENTGF